MKNIKLVTLFPERLNLNGDQANLLVLQKRLKWLGFESQVISVESAAELAAVNGDFLFLGHGSLAAWQACLKDWPTLAHDFYSASSDTNALAISSAGDMLLALATGVEPNYAESTSEFVVEGLESRRILGYKNTCQLNNSTQQIGNLLLTWLHGPVLAKNPELADALIRKLLGSEAPTDFANGNTRKIDEIVAGVWKIEDENS